MSELINLATGKIVEPDTTCPKCGKPWKEGADYGHTICCGCVVCGWSDTIIELPNCEDMFQKTNNKMVAVMEEPTYKEFSKMIQNK